MNIRELANKLLITDAETAGTVYNGGDRLGIKFFMDDEALIVDMPTDKAAALAQLIQDSIKRGKIV
jgi:hypothetical protein